MNMMISPVVPTFPLRFVPDWTVVIGSLALCTIATIVAFFVGIMAAKGYQENPRKVAWLFAGITATVSLLLIGFFGCTAMAIKGCILCLILGYCSYCDYKTRECPDYPYLMIAIAAFIETDPTALPGMFLSAGFTFGVLIFAMLAIKSQVNGADLKLATACTFLLGIEKGIGGLILGLLLAVGVNLIKQKDKKAGFPLIPYLAVGYMAAYLV